jgi:hypothetical protein
VRSSVNRHGLFKVAQRARSAVLECWTNSKTGDRVAPFCCDIVHVKSVLFFLVKAFHRAFGILRGEVRDKFPERQVQV